MHESEVKLVFALKANEDLDKSTYTSDDVHPFHYDEATFLGDTWIIGDDKNEVKLSISGDGRLYAFYAAGGALATPEQVRRAIHIDLQHSSKSR